MTSYRFERRPGVRGLQSSAADHGVQTCGAPGATIDLQPQRSAAAV